MPPRTRLNQLNCSLAHALDSLGDGWALLIVRNLCIGTHQFGEIQKSLGIARTVLAARLEQLERAEILERRGTERRPLYFLTKKGRDLFPALVALMQWGDRWASPEGPPVKLTDAHGRVAAPIVVQTREGDAITAEDARFAAGPGAVAATRTFLKTMAVPRQNQHPASASPPSRKSDRSHG